MAEVFSAVDHRKDGLIDEEFLFWDNLTFMRQVGIAPQPKLGRRASPKRDLGQRDIPV
jgi:hypothetical protein